MRRKLTTDTQAIEVRLFAPLAPGEPVPLMQTPVIPAGEILHFSAEEDEPDSVRVAWRGKTWRIDRADWDLAEMV
jgi:hypothetical protein